MQSQDIRLRLVIRRHGVPEIKLVWPCACSEDLTIAKLLELVNDVVTLETGEWGLEDYAVELADSRGGSFECLHFQQVGRILKDEDQVLIRALLSGDLKRRRLSGRHQVSVDGRHLVDGITFGRPWLRTPRDRPPIELPPRKRVRIAYNPQPDDEEEQEQLLLGAPNSSRARDSGSGRLKARFNDEHGEVEEYGEDECHEECCSSRGGRSFAADGAYEDDSEENEESTSDEDEDEDEDDEDADDEDEDLQEKLQDAVVDNGISHFEEEYVKRQDFVESDDDDFEEPHLDVDEDEDEDDHGMDEDEDLQEEAQFLRREIADIEEDPLSNLLNIDNLDEHQVAETEDEDDEDFDDEFRRLKQENAAMREPLARLLASSRNADSPNSPDFSPFVAALWTAFPSVPIEEIELELMQVGRDLKRAYTSLASLHDPVMSYKALLNRTKTLLPELFPDVYEMAISGRSDCAASKAVRPLIEEIESIEEPEGNGVAESSSARPKKNQRTTSDATANSDESDSSGSSSDSEEDESNSETDSDHDSSSGSEEENQTEVQAPKSCTLQDKSGDSSSEPSSSDDDSSESDSDLDIKKSSARVDESSDSSDDSDSDSSGSDSSDASDSEPEETLSRPPIRSTVMLPSPHQPQAESSTCERNPTTSAAEILDDESAPGDGLARTKKRNARRRRNKHLRQRRLLESETTLENRTEDAPSQELLARKQALLAAIVNDATGITKESPAIDDNIGKGDEQTKEPPTVDVPTEDPQEAPQETPSERPQDGSPGSKDESAKRRNRFDLGAGRRLLFSALGLRAPKTKADEEKIRQKLMKDVRPLNNARLKEADSQPGHGDENHVAVAATEEQEDNPDSWKDKIVYRAVECCHDDMVLSEPPFPFVQRWDPQQKYDNMRKRKRAFENYQAEASFAEDESYYYDDDEARVEQEAGRKKKKKKNKKKGKATEVTGQSGGKANANDENVVLNYDDEPVQSSLFTDLDDLPSLPNEPSTLPILEPGTAKPGMVITWKQLLMSKATKWQPELVSVTGLVIPGGDDSTLHIVLAKRDREQNDKVYDDETGERIYDKFEVPDMDEADEEDTGFRTMQWGEMIEPRLLQNEPTTGMVGTPMTPNGTGWGEKKPSPDDEQTDAEVSDIPTLEECLANQLSTEQVRAGVEEDMRQDALKDTQENPESVSIQSGQQMPRLDLSTSGDEAQVSTTSDSWEMLKHKYSDLSRTLEAQSEEAFDGTASPGKSQSHDLGESVQEEDETAADQEAEPASCLAGDVSDSDEAVSKTGHSPGDHGTTNDTIDMPMANEPASSQPSVGSGRQPQADYNMEDPLEDDTVIPETLPQLREATPTSNDLKQAGTPSTTSSSPFPSIEELFMSARQTQSPTKKRETPALFARKPTLKRDLEYEEATRKLDEGHESEDSPSKKEDVGDLFPNATQPPAPVGFAKEESPSPQTSFVKTERQKRGRSPFVVPEGSQVIVLSSSASPSPEPDEDDGLCNVEATTAAAKRSTLPTGPGWAKKSNDGVLRARLKSLPAMTGATGRTRRSAASPSAPLVSAVSKYKGGKGNFGHVSWRR